MSESPFARHAGVIALVAGALFLASQLAVYLTLDTGDLQASAQSWPYRISAFAMMWGFAGLAVAAVAIYARGAARSGAMAATALGFALVGTVFLAGDWWFETFGVAWYAEVAPEVLDIRGSGWLAVGGLLSYVTFAIGWAAFGFTQYRARVFAPAACLGVVVGGLVGYGDALPPYGAPLGLAIAWLGAVSLREPRDTPPVTSHVDVDAR